MAVSYLTGKPRQKRLGVGWATVYGVDVPPAERSELEVLEVDDVPAESLDPDQLVFIGTSDPSPLERVTLAHELTHGRIVKRRDLHRRAVLPLRLALVQVQLLSLDVVHAAELFGVADRRQREAALRNILGWPPTVPERIVPFNLWGRATLPVAWD